MRVLIVGGGIAGLAMAPARASFAAEVVEQGASVGRRGHGYLPAREWLPCAARLSGLHQAVLERGIVIARQRVSDHRGRLLVEIDLAGPAGRRRPLLGALHRADLHDVLLDGALATCQSGWVSPAGSTSKTELPSQSGSTMGPPASMTS